jgi:hypothetical protein
VSRTDGRVLFFRLKQSIDRTSERWNVMQSQKASGSMIPCRSVKKENSIVGYLINSVLILL